MYKYVHAYIFSLVHCPLFKRSFHRNIAHRPITFMLIVVVHSLSPCFLFLIFKQSPRSVLYSIWFWCSNHKHHPHFPLLLLWIFTLMASFYWISHFYFGVLRNHCLDNLNTFHHLILILWGISPFIHFCLFPESLRSVK